MRAKKKKKSRKREVKNADTEPKRAHSKGIKVSHEIQLLSGKPKANFYHEKTTQRTQFHRKVTK